MILRGGRRLGKSNSVWFLLVLLWTVVLFLAFGGKGSVGIRCGTFEEKLGPNQCKNYVANHYRYIILDEESGDNFLNKSTISDLAFASLFPLSLLPKKCRIPASRLVCSSAFQPCSIQPLSPSLPNFLVFPLPRSPCRSLCESLIKGCEEVEGFPFPNCTAVDPATGRPTYPTSFATWEVNGQLFDVPCNDLIPKLKAKEVVPLSCPEPTELKEEGLGEPPCAVPCLVVFSDDQYEILEYLIFVFPPFSLASVIFLLITWFSIREWRQFPANLFILPFFAMAVAESTLIGTSIIGPRKVICHDHFTRATDDDWRCSGQSAILIWSTVAGATAWCCIAINIFSLVVLEFRPQQVARFQIPYFLTVLLVPSIPIFFVALPTGMMAYSGVLIWCDAGDVSLWGVNQIYASLIVITIIMIASVIIKLALKDRELLKNNLHLILFMGILVWVLTATITISWYFYLHSDEWTDAFVEFTQCNAALRDDCELRSQAPFWPVIVITFAYASLGVQVLIVLLQRSFLYHWYAVFHHIRRKNWRALLDMNLAEDKKIYDGVSSRSTMSRPKSSAGISASVSSGLKDTSRGSVSR